MRRSKLLTEIEHSFSNENCIVIMFSLNVFEPVAEKNLKKNLIGLTFEAYSLLLLKLVGNFW